VIFTAGRLAEASIEAGGIRCVPPIRLHERNHGTNSRYGGELSEESIAEIFASMDSSADRLTRIVDELMDVSRIEKQEVVLHKKTSDMGQLLLRAIKGVRARGGGATTST